MHNDVLHVHFNMQKKKMENIKYFLRCVDPQIAQGAGPTCEMSKLLNVHVFLKKIFEIKKKKLDSMCGL